MLIKEQDTARHHYSRWATGSESWHRRVVGDNQGLEQAKVDKLEPELEQLRSGNVARR